MSENPLSANLSDPGSGSTGPGPQTAPRSTQDPGRAIVDALTRDHDALQADMEAIGRDFRKALEPAVSALRQSVANLLKHQCPLCGLRLMTLAGVKAHVSNSHSWWERAKHWAKRWRKP